MYGSEGTGPLGTSRLFSGVGPVLEITHTRSLELLYLFYDFTEQ